MAFDPIYFPRDDQNQSAVGSETVFVRLFGAAASGKQPGGIEELERSRRERERESRLFLQVTTTCGQARC